MAATTKMDGKARTVAEGIQLRNGRYIVRIWNASKGKQGGYDWHSLPLGSTIRQARDLKRELGNQKAIGRRRGSGSTPVGEWVGHYAVGAKVPALVCRGCGAEMRRKATLCNFCMVEGQPAVLPARMVVASGEAWVPGLWLKVWPRPSETTNVHYDSQVRAFARKFAGRMMDSVTEEEAQLFVLEFPSTFKEVHAMFNDAMKSKRVGHNPFTGLRTAARRGRSDIAVLKDVELERLAGIARAVHGQYGDVFAAMIETAAWTGVRPGELFLFALEPSSDPDVKLNHVDLDAGIVHVDWQLTKAGIKRPKYGSVRKVVLLPGAEAALRSIKSWQAGQPVFRTKRGCPFDKRTQFYYWDPVRAAFAMSLPAGHHLCQRTSETGGENLDFYELRHYFGTKLAHPPAGVTPASPYEIAAMMGHKDGGQLAMRVYIHVDDEEAQESIRNAWRKAA